MSGLLSWLRGLGSELRISLDRGGFFRHPMQWLYAVVAVLYTAVAVLGPLVMLVATVMAATNAYNAKQYPGSVQLLSGGSLLALAILNAAALGAYLLWARMADLKHLSMGRKFVVGPLMAHVVRTWGEVTGITTGLFGFLSFLAVWPLGQGLASLPWGGQFLAHYLMPGWTTGLFAPVSGFLIVLGSRWLADGIEVLFSIANDVRGTPPDTDGGPSTQSASGVEWNAALVGLILLAYLLLALPLHLALPILPAIVLLIIAVGASWFRATGALLGFSLVLAVGAFVALLGEGKPDSLSAFYLGSCLPGLPILFALGLAATVLVFLHRAGHVDNGGSAMSASLWGIGLAMLFFTYPTVATVREAGLRHELTPDELASAKGLLRDYEHRRFGAYQGARVDTVTTVLIDSVTFRADLYGTITYQHSLPLGDRRASSEFKGDYRSIRLPDSLLYVAGRDSFYVHYLNGDSLRIRPLRRRNVHRFIALDVMHALAQVREKAKLERFLAYRDSLNQFVDTLTGEFLGYECSAGPCFARFNVAQDGGHLNRPFFCPEPIVSGNPLGSIPKDKTPWRLVVRESVIATSEAQEIGSGPMVYELYRLLPFVNPAVNEPAQVEVEAPRVKPTDTVVPKATPTTAKIFKPEEVDVLPRFTGGRDGLKQYLRANLRYPVPEKQAGTTGKTVVGFTVTSTGKVTNISVQRTSTNDNLDNEAKRLIGAMTGWTPGNKDGKAVDVQMRETVEFNPNN